MMYSKCPSLRTIAELRSEDASLVAKPEVPECRFVCKTKVLLQKCTDLFIVKGPRACRGLLACSFKDLTRRLLSSLCFVPVRSPRERSRGQQLGC